jgi:hypothetical protein
MSNNSQYKYVLYGSGRCENTKEFIKQLSQFPNLNKAVMKIDVHDKRYKIPSNVKSIPALIVPGINEPLVGDMAFAWLSQQKQQVGRGVASAQDKPSGPGGFSDWNADFSSGSLSDSFSYLDGSNIAHNYEFLGGHGNLAQGAGPTTGMMGISTSADGGYSNGGGSRHEKSELEKKMEEFQRQRDADVPPTMAQKRMAMNNSLGGPGGGSTGFGSGAPTYRTL